VTTQSARSCVDGVPNIVPTVDDAIAFSRSAGQVLDIVYLAPAAVTSGASSRTASTATPTPPTTTPDLRLIAA